MLSSLTAVGGDLEIAMQLSEQQLRAIVPEEGPGVDSACPVCRTYHRWQWSPLEPDRIVCQPSGTVFPNPEYPADRKAVMLNYRGEKRTVAYWEGPVPHCCWSCCWGQAGIRY